MSQQEISKLILKLIEKHNVNYLKLMNWNLFRYLVQVIGDPTTSETLQKGQGMEESSIYNRQKVKKKETKNDVYLQNENAVSEWISLSLDKKSFTDLERIEINEKLKLVNMSSIFLSRNVNEGFSGGEKKRNEILQMILLESELSILDETDSGLDIDALKIISKGINTFMDSNKAIILITHYQRLLDYIKPDYVHVMQNGKIIKTGTAELAKELEIKGYEWLS